MKTKQIAIYFIVSTFFLLGCAGPSIKSTRAVDHSLSDNTYVNRTDNCKLSMPLTGNWSMTLKNEGDDVLDFKNEKLYEASGSLSIQKLPVMTLEMLKVGVVKTYGIDAMLDTIDIAGKKAILVERTVVVLGNQKFVTRAYSIVKDSIPKIEGQGWTEGIVYNLVFAYRPQGAQDKEFLKQIDDIVQSFAYLDEQPDKISSAVPKDK